MSEYKEGKKNILKKKRTLVFGLISIITVILCLKYYYYSITYVSTDNAYIEGQNIQISSKVSGHIDKIYINDNQKVKKGQLILEINNDDYQVKFEQAHAKLEAAIEKEKGAAVNVNLTSITSKSLADQANSSINSAKALIDVANKQISQANANLAQAHSEINSAKAEFKLAEINRERYEKIYEKGGISKLEFDKALTIYKTSKAKLDIATEKALSAKSMIELAQSNKVVALESLEQALSKFKGLNTVEQQISMSSSQEKIANAEIKQLKAAEKQAKFDLSYTKLYAPKDGIITKKTIEEGSYVQVGQPLLSIIPEERWIIANFKENQLKSMKIGQPVSIKIDAYPNKIFKGKIESFQFSTGSKTSLFPPENAVGSFVKVVQRIPVKIIFTERPDSKYIIVPGMSAIPEVKIR